MPDLHMNFFTPSDLLWLEREVAGYIRMILRSRPSDSSERILELNFIVNRQELSVRSAFWHTDQGITRDVVFFFKSLADESDILHVPSNISAIDYLELVFLKVTNGFGGALCLKVPVECVGSPGSPRVKLNKYLRDLPI